MATFTYDPATLTAEQRELIALAIESRDEALAELQKQEDRRMENYYNCVDDYSWGGLCSKANIMARDRVKRNCQERIEEIVRGGFLVKTRRVNILRDIETGEVAACGVREGEYGPYFKTYEAFGSKYISFAKRISTYEKKGFRPFVQIVTEKVKRDGCWRDGNPRYKHIDYISITEELSTERCY